MARIIQSPTPEYRAWVAMRQRCTNPRCIEWPSYGGRGIKVEECWSTFEAFLKDMGPRPSSAYSLDRKDNNKDYSPSNCKWSTQTEQNRNKRYHVFVNLNGEKVLCADAMRALRILPNGMYHRIRKFGETHQQVVDHYKRLRGG